MQNIFLTSNPNMLQLGVSRVNAAAIRPTRFREGSLVLFCCTSGELPCVSNVDSGYNTGSFLFISIKCKRSPLTPLGQNIVRKLRYSQTRRKWG